MKQLAEYVHVQSKANIRSYKLSFLYDAKLNAGYM